MELRAETPGTLRAWYLAARPWSLPASVVPVLVGTALAFSEGHLDPLLFALTLAGSVLVQVGTNLVDEYTDHQRSRGQGKALAPYKVIALGLLSARAVRQGALLSFGLATLIGLSIVWAVGWPVLAVCLASLGAAYTHSGGPKPLGSLGLGELVVFLFMGPVMVTATYYVQAQAVSGEALLLSLPVGFLVAAILVINNLRDTEEDRAQGKTTAVTALGKPFAVALFRLLLIGAFLSVLLMAAIHRPSLPLLAALLALPKALAAARRVARGRPRPILGEALRQTAGLHLHFGLLLAAGLAARRLLGL